MHQIELEMLNEDLRRAQIALDIARDRYFDLFDLAPVGYCTLSAGGLIQEANLTAANLLGVSRSALLKSHFSAFIIPEDQDRFYLLRRKLLQAGVSDACDLQMIREGKQCFWAHLVATLTLDENEAPLCRVVISDASERKRAEAALRTALAQADVANQAKTQFLSTMSHEIRTPLNGIIGLTDTLMQSGLPPAQAQMLKIIQDCGNSLMAVIGDVLNLARIESGNMELDSSILDVQSLFKDTCGLFTASTVIKDLTLTSRIDPGVPRHLRGDAVRIRQVLINLIGNAVKFNDQGAITMTASATTAGPDRIMLTCEVSDTGPGIPATFLPHIFEPFKQADATMTRRHGGSGLGLAIAKRLTGLMGGTLTVESSVGRGSRFRFSVPLTVENAGTSVAASAAAVPQRMLSHPLSVLVVEDDHTCQFTLQVMLEELGCRCRLVENGQLALAAVENGGIDLVLMDCEMPLVDGFAATSAIRKLGQGVSSHQLPIIALTAHAFTEHANRCRDVGMDDVLAKPCSLESLKACLMRWGGAATASRADPHDGGPTVA